MNFLNVSQRVGFCLEPIASYKVGEKKQLQVTSPMSLSPYFGVNDLVQVIQRDLFIPLFGGHLTVKKGHVFTIPKRSPAELPG